MPDSQARLLDQDNPWPGLESFSERNQKFFRGRDRETRDLLRLVRRETLTVLFGASGLGKTSLIQAGLFPKLRDAGHIPVSVRVDYSPQAPSPRAQLLRALAEACAAQQVESPPIHEGDTLWQFFHRTGADFWSARNRPVAPVIVIDQFEEAFAHEHDRTELGERWHAFRRELGNLVENRVPDSIKAALDEDPEIDVGFDFHPASVRLVLSFREDFLAHVEGLKREIPSLTYNRLRLEPMTGLQAHDVVNLGGGNLVDGEVARRIVELAAGVESDASQAVPVSLEELEVEPPLLSVICRELNEQRKSSKSSKQPTITDAIVDAAGRRVLPDFYEKSFDGIAANARTFIEEHLLTDSGLRNSFPYDDAKRRLETCAPDLDELVKRRLLRIDQRSRVRRLELTHDVLAPIALASRNVRRADERAEAVVEEEREKRRRLRRFAVAMAIVIGALLVISGLAGWVALLRGQQRDEANAALSDLLVVQAERFKRDHFDRALLLNVEAARSAPVPEVGPKFLDLFQARPLLDGFLTGREGFLPGTESIRSIAQIGRDGKPMLAVADEASLTRWDLTTRRWLDTLFEGRIRALTSSEDGRRLAAATMEGKLLVWDLADEEPAMSELRDFDGVVSIAYRPDGELLAAGARDGRVALLEADPPRIRNILEQHQASVQSVAFSEDGARLASADNDGKVIVLELASGRSLTLPGTDDPVVSLAFDAGSARLAAASSNGRIEVHDIETRGAGARGPAVLSGHRRAVRDITFVGDGPLAVSASDDGTLRLWNVDTEDFTVLEGRAGALNTVVALTPPNRGATNTRGGERAPPRLASGAADGRVLLWSLPPLEGMGATNAYTVLQSQGHPVYSVAFNPGGPPAGAFGDEFGTVTLWFEREGAWELVRLTQSHEEPVNDLAFSATGDILASGSEDGAIVLVDLATREPGRRLELEGGAVLGVAIAPDGTRLAAASSDGSINLWTLKPDAPTAPELLGVHPDEAVNDVGFSHDGTRIASASDDGSVVLWDTRGEREPRRMLDHGASVSSVAFSPDDSQVASASANGTVIVWHLTGDERIELVGHEAPVVGLAFDPRSRAGSTILASADAHGDVIVWAVEEAKNLVELRTRGEPVQGIAFSPDGGQLATASSDGSVIIWDWDPESLARKGCRIANRNLSQREWAQYVRRKAYRETCPELGLIPGS